MKQALIALFSFIAACGAQAAPTSLVDCRAIAEPTARLACYDALPIAAAAAAPAAVAATPAAAAATPTPTGGWFGLTRPDTDTGTTSISSTVPGHFMGWHAGSRIKLANGQVWQVSDDSETFWETDDPKVTVTPGFGHSFFMNFVDLKVSARVRRVQ